MSLLTLGSVWQNFLTIVIVFAVFFMVYKSMREGKAKNTVKGLFDKMKSGGKDGN